MEPLHPTGNRSDARYRLLDLDVSTHERTKTRSVGRTMIRRHMGIPLGPLLGSSPRNRTRITAKSPRVRFKSGTPASIQAKGGDVKCPVNTSRSQD